MSDVKNIITLGIGASPEEIGYFILDGLSSYLDTAAVYAVTVQDTAGFRAVSNIGQLITLGIGAEPGKIGYFILDGFSAVLSGSASAVSVSDVALGAVSVSDAAGV